MAKQATSIFINDSMVSILTASGKHVQKWGSIPLETGMVRDGAIIDIDGVVGKVKELCKTEHAGGRVIAGVSGINCLYRIVTLPNLPGNMLPEAVEREAARVLGVPLGQLYLSWQTLPSNKTETKVYLAASPRKTVDTLISTLRKAGLNPYLMDLKPLALARTSTEHEAIILDVQPASFDIVILTNTIPQVVRSLSLAPDASQEEKLSIIRDELERAITFYDSSHKDTPLEPSVPLLVSGEIAGQEDAWELLVGEQGRQVRILPCPLEAPDEFPSSQYMANIGLAFKEIADKGGAAFSLVNFNVLPQVFRPKPRPVHEVLFIPVLIGGIALIVLGAFVLTGTISKPGTPSSYYPTILKNFVVSGTSPYVDELQLQLDNLTETIASKTTEAQAEIKDYEAEIKTLTEQVTIQKRGQGELVGAYKSILDPLGPNKEIINADLGEMNKGAGELNLLKVDHNTKTMTIKGIANDEDLVFSYASNLRASGRFALVVISNISFDEGSSKTSFTLTLTKAEEETE